MRNIKMCNWGFSSNRWVAIPSIFLLSVIQNDKMQMPELTPIFEIQVIFFFLKKMFNTQNNESTKPAYSSVRQLLLMPWFNSCQRYHLALTGCFIHFSDWKLKTCWHVEIRALINQETLHVQVPFQWGQTLIKCKRSAGNKTLVCKALSGLIIGSSP